MNKYFGINKAEIVCDNLENCKQCGIHLKTPLVKSDLSVDNHNELKKRNMHEQSQKQEVNDLLKKQSKINKSKIKFGKKSIFVRYGFCIMLLLFCAFSKIDSFKFLNKYSSALKNELGKNSILVVDLNA